MPNKKILIVEDEYITALDLKIQITMEGNFDFDIVDSGEEAVKKAQNKEYDLILMDIKLKGKIDGIEAARKIREKSDTALVYVSGNLDLLDPDKLERAKPLGVMKKPISEHKLRNLVKKVFS